MTSMTILLGRVLLVLVFLGSGFNKITNFSGTQEYMESYGMPAAGFLLFGAIIFEIVGGLSVLLGFKARVGAVLLILFLIPATLIFHLEPGDQNQMILLMKNLAILGGLLLILSHGSGPLSLDAKLKGGH